MPALVSGLSITETSQVSTNLNRSRIAATVFVVTRTVAGSAADNSLVKIESLADIAAKIGTVPTVVTASYEFFKSISPSSEIYMIPGKGATTTLQHLQAGLIAILTVATNVALANIVVPEGGALALADRATLFASAEAIAATNGWDWIYHHQLGADCDTKAEADTESAALNSPQGNSFISFGYCKDSSSRDVPRSVVEAGWLVWLAQNRDLVRSPAGYYLDNPAINAVATVELKYQLTLAEMNDALKTKKYNFWQFYRDKFYLWGCNTASSDKAWVNQNTRLSFSQLQARLAGVGIGSLFKPTNTPSGASSALGKIAAVYEVLAQAAADGFFAQPKAVDGVIPPSYRVVSVDTASGQQVLELRCYPIQSDREVAYTLVNTDAP